MKKTLIICALLSSFSISAQSIERQVLGSTGGTATTTGVIVTSTVGETAVATLTATMILTQGYHQANEESVGIEDIQITASFAFYPNPSNGNSTLEITTSQHNAELSIAIYAADGKLIKTQTASCLANQTTSIPIDISNEARGVYHLHIMDSKQHSVKDLKIVKQ